MIYPDDFINKVIQGDCIEVMQHIPDKSIDLVLTDPPYGISKAEWDYIDFFPFIENLYREIVRVLRDGRVAFIWFPKKKIYELHKLSFPFDVFICTKNFSQKRATDILIDCWVPILMVSNGKAKSVKGNGLGKNWFMINTANTSDHSCHPRNVGHPTPKDPELCKYILNCASTETDLILDPFLGSGTTAVACKRLNRRFIGIEISEKYCQIARDRLNNEAEPLFKEPLFK
jgi:site-specific DNA-methyltransferase (adenine-specific)